MYNKLNDDDIRELDKKLLPGRVVISHVGDGEYTCNVLGNVFSSFSMALKSARVVYPKANIYAHDQFEHCYIATGGRESYDSYIRLPDLAYLSIEIIDDVFNSVA